MFSNSGHNTTQDRKKAIPTGQCPSCAGELGTGFTATGDVSPEWRENSLFYSGLGVILCDMYLKKKKKIGIRRLFKQGTDVGNIAPTGSRCCLWHSHSPVIRNTCKFDSPGFLPRCFSTSHSMCSVFLSFLIGNSLDQAFILQKAKFNHSCHRIIQS